MVLYFNFSSGTICGLCYYGEKSLLGQGDLSRYDPTPGFNPFRRPSLKTRGSRESFSGLSPASDCGDRTGKSPSRSRSRETRHRCVKKHSLSFTFFFYNCKNTETQKCKSLKKFHVMFFDIYKSISITVKIGTY